MYNNPNAKRPNPKINSMLGLILMSSIETSATCVNRVYVLKIVAMNYLGLNLHLWKKVCICQVILFFGISLIHILPKLV